MMNLYIIYNISRAQKLTGVGLNRQGVAPGTIGRALVRCRAVVSLLSCHFFLLFVTFLGLIREVN